MIVGFRKNLQKKKDLKKTDLKLLLNSTAGGINLAVPTSFHLPNKLPRAISTK